MQLLHLDKCIPDPDGNILNMRVDFGRTLCCLTQTGEAISIANLFLSFATGFACGNVSSLAHWTRQ